MEKSLKIIGLYGADSREEFQVMETFIKYYVVGKAINKKILVDKNVEDETLEKYNIDRLPAFVVIDSRNNPIAKVDNGSLADLEELAVLSGKHFK